MDISDIEVFVEIVDAQSFSKAAQRLKTPPTTVSAKLSRLEESLGTTLIRRTTRKLFVTDVGRAFYDHCVSALATLEAGRQQISFATQEPSGLLRIATPADFSQCLLASPIEIYLDKFPKVSIELVITTKEVDLLAQRIDLAVRVGPLKDSSLLARKIAETSVGLWASQNYLDTHGVPKQPEDLAHHQILRFHLFGPDIKLKSGSHEFAMDFGARLISDDMENLKNFILRGNGIGLLPDFMVQEKTQKDKLVHVLPSYAFSGAEIFLVYPAQRFVPPSVREFINLAVAAEHQQKNKPTTASQGGFQLS